MGSIINMESKEAIARIYDPYITSEEVNILFNELAYGQHQLNKHRRLKNGR